MGREMTAARVLREALEEHPTLLMVWLGEDDEANDRVEDPEVEQVVASGKGTRSRPQHNLQAPR